MSKQCSPLWCSLDTVEVAPSISTNPSSYVYDGRGSSCPRNCTHSPGTLAGFKSGAPNAIPSRVSAVDRYDAATLLRVSHSLMATKAGGEGPPTTAKPSRGSGKEKASDAPSWVKNDPEGKPKQGESGKDFAERMLDGKYGEGNYPKGPGSEYSQIKKYGERSFK